jgi:hypothetical protein
MDQKATSGPRAKSFQLLSARHRLLIRPEAGSGRWTTQRLRRGLAARLKWCLVSITFA